MPQTLISRIPRGKHLARMATRRNLNALNRRQDAAMLAKLSTLRAALEAEVARRAASNPELAQLFRALVGQVVAMQAMELEDAARHSTERAVVDADARSYIEEVAA